MNKGDLIRIHWVDIANWATASPDDAHPIAMRTVGHFAGWFNDKARGKYLCLSDTVCEAEPGKEEVFYGACAFPKGCIREIEEFTMRRKTKKKKKEPPEE